VIDVTHLVFQGNTLKVMPQPGVSSGSATITVTVKDRGAQNDLTPGSDRTASASTTFNVSVTDANRLYTAKTGSNNTWNAYIYFPEALTFDQANSHAGSLCVNAIPAHLP